MMKQPIAIALITIPLIAIVVSLFNSTESDKNSTATTGYNSTSEGVEMQSQDQGKEQKSESQLPYVSEHGALASSLRGIYFDRTLSVDNDGNLRLSTDLKDIFDFFFSAIEEEPLDTVLSRIAEYLEYQLDEPALSQANKALADYVKYKSALYEFELEQSELISQYMPDGTNTNAVMTGDYLNFIAQRMTDVKLLRSEHLGLELHDAFFASREQYDDYMIQKIQINADSTLTAEQKNTALLALDNQMPEEFISARRDANPVELMQAEISHAVSTGNPEEIHQARVDAVGEDAANRLKALDAERAEWDTRYHNYATQRDSIVSNKGLSSEAKAIEIQLLRKSMFSETELLRISALDRIQK